MLLGIPVSDRLHWASKFGLQFQIALETGRQRQCHRRSLLWTKTNRSGQLLLILPGRQQTGRPKDSIPWHHGWPFAGSRPSGIESLRTPTRADSQQRIPATAALSDDLRSRWRRIHATAPRHQPTHCRFGGKQLRTISMDPIQPNALASYTSILAATRRCFIFVFIPLAYFVF